jgi:PAS domain S-box-containing protein
MPEPHPGARTLAAAPTAPHARATPELWEVNEQLLLAGLREQALAEQLSRQLAFFTAITTSLADGVLTVDSARHITFANPAAQQILGWPAGDLEGRDAQLVLALLHAPATPRGADGAFLVAPLGAGTTLRDQQAIWTRHDGTHFPVTYAAAPIRTNAQVVGAVVTFHDRSAIERLQQQRDDYLALLSHDLRAPLTVILGYANLLERRLTTHALPREAQNAQAIMAGVAHMTTLIAAVLDHSVLERG